MRSHGSAHTPMILIGSSSGLRYCREMCSVGSPNTMDEPPPGGFRTLSDDRCASCSTTPDCSPPGIAGLITSVQEEPNPDRRQMRPSCRNTELPAAAHGPDSTPTAMRSTATGRELCSVARSMPSLLCCWPGVLVADRGSIRVRMSGWPTAASCPAYCPATDFQLGLLPCEIGCAGAGCCVDGFWMTGRHLLRAAEDVGPAELLQLGVREGQIAGGAVLIHLLRKYVVPLRPRHHRQPPYALLYCSPTQECYLHLKCSNGTAILAIIRFCNSGMEFRCVRRALGDAD